MYRLMIVDDEYATLNGLSNYIPWGDLGFEVKSKASNGKQALENLQRQDIDVILTDIRMPVMDGMELIRRIREENLPIEIILLSAYRDFEYAKEGIRFGVHDYILKPTKYEEIKTVFANMKKKLDSRMEEKNSESEEEEIYRSISGIVKTYVEKNPGTANLEDVSEIVNMNPQYLSRLFKKETGQNFSEYVMEMKMRRAQKLLCNSRYRIGEIGEMLGYTNSKNFARAFHARYGMSPREYRESRER